MSNYTPPVGGNNNYMNNWGNPNRIDRAANQIDHIADKASFAIDMINTALLAIDSIEKELVELSNAPVPPQPTTLTSLAHRLDTNQKQVKDGLDKIKTLMAEIDRTTDHLQRNDGWK
ncbi:hypothetical protein [Paenibacillus mucilaginosus]|uniref:Uncharacterized protein n=3 Tax=Paenibacillus mucilaginosus TaxID=61624 RepID=H6NBD9_9BACL|nr:hypothetical protein [Paenibacillus mucilaginosus]AEI45140.1 hypothetical protein KNP414_06619 [Paenibacillus mucilaginosus KNP414]AFC32885.1 hypothetical protein PM3016_6249 [Paenibacillus mucilaginosus 3016]AFH65196.1 hypothetical protein B2K_31560 [Paenibacillus mucilaginosus K02]MCG7212967.1 hypothetical protein [Paenibacillus mucilaginosus]WDM26621.1 hypothetical protein KCX80_30035 [Paenibacillus mucilaginosus]